MPTIDAIEALLIKGEHWIWPGPVNRAGYGRIWVVGLGKRLVHRAVYEARVGPIPVGLTLDHTCKTRLCAKPDHLEPVPLLVNIRRSVTRGTHCRKGHPYDRLWKGRNGVPTQNCSICHRAGYLRAAARRRQR